MRGKSQGQGFPLKASRTFLQIFNCVREAALSNLKFRFPPRDMNILRAFTTLFSPSLVAASSPLNAYTYFFFSGRDVDSDSDDPKFAHFCFHHISLWVSSISSSGSSSFIVIIIIIIFLFFSFLFFFFLFFFFFVFCCFCLMLLSFFFFCFLVFRSLSAFFSNSTIWSSIILPCRYCSMFSARCGAKMQDQRELSSRICCFHQCLCRRLQTWNADSHISRTKTSYNRGHDVSISERPFISYSKVFSDYCYYDGHDDNNMCLCRQLWACV